MSAIHSATHIGTAGWTIPKEFAARFPKAGSHLGRYSQVLSGVEINSSFYRDHKPDTYARWAETVPEHFRFSVKLLKKFTHESRFESHEGLHETIAGIQQLGEKLGALLVQLPPSFAFEEDLAREFFQAVRESFDGTIAFEPRHATWSENEAIDLMEEYRVSKVLADPERVLIPKSKRARVMPTAYFRLHGSPVMYRSDYEKDRLVRIETAIRAHEEAGRPVWCIFDNTTFGYATANACEIQAGILSPRPGSI